MGMRANAFGSKNCFLLQASDNLKERLGAIEVPGGFLFQWWSVFWDKFIARTNEKHSEALTLRCLADETAVLLLYSLVQGNSDFLEYVLMRTDVDTLVAFSNQKGGCGEVYKAELPGRNGKMIAIKNIIQPSKEATELTEEDSKLLNKKMQQIWLAIAIVGQI
ncbi:hypothetical protein SLEP1_g30566 [Rubroshorea leprosula]|uniref:Uncharacterized protein n=1 Tax=Rubroshorea leprosula TaxID=152421 RepID=A0AAV5K2X2_9ROSI|nr:hypothetical protein SLEP1_g30566 [Rubroshorea leprosula]